MAERDLARFLEDKIDRFMSSEDAGDKMRRSAELHIDYYDGKQWTDAEVKELKRRGQPAITQNLIKQKIEFLQGLEKTQRTVPNALPRTPKHEEEAHGATDALRFIADDNRYNPARSAAWADLLKAGWGGFQIIAEEDTRSRSDMMASTAMVQPNYRIVINRCQWDRMFWDPYSSEPDYSDASFLGMVVWMDRDEAVRRYGEGAGQVFDETVATVATSTFDDKPKNYTWVAQGKRKRVRVVQMYFIADDGEWDYVEFTKGGILESGPSPWQNEDGEREHPYAWQSAYVDRDNARYGAIRDLIDMQDEVNKRRSKALHTINSRQTFGNARALGEMTAREMRKEMARPDGHIPLSADAQFGRDWGVIPTSDIASGNMEMLAQAMGIFEDLGANASLQGKSDGQDSGRAILAKQQAGAVQMGTLTDTLRELDLEVYRKAWRRVRQFWTGETWVRVTDDEKNLKWVGFNQPVTQPMMMPQLDPSTGQAVMAPMMGPDGQPMEQPVIDPSTGQPILNNAVADMDVDIEIDTAPDMGTLQQEEFQNMVELARIGVVFPPKVYLSASNLRNKGELIRMLDEAGQQQNQPSPEQQAAMQLEFAGAEAEVRKTNAEADDRQASAVQKIAEMQLGALMAGRPQPLPVTA